MKNSYPPYSILTSVYNGEKFIEGYFKTVFDQEIQPNQIVLIDDTKNPINFPQIIDSYRKKNPNTEIVLIKNPINLGPCKSLNKGLEKCNNDLIFRLDFDDLWKKNHTKKLINVYLNDDQYLIYANNLKYTNLRNFIKCDPFFINENPLIHSSWMINRNVCKSFKYYLENPVLALEDWFTILHYTRKGYKVKSIYNYHTVIFIENPNSHGREYQKNKKFLNYRKKIAMSLFNYNFKLIKKSKIELLKRFGIFSYLVFVFWTLDIIKLKKIFRR